MAMLIKDRFQGSSAGATRTGYSILTQWIHIVRPAAALPQSSTEMLFRVFGGKVLIYRLYGEVTTVIQAQATNHKWTHKRLSNAGVAVGTAVDLSANVDLNALEVGGSVIALGSGAAAIKNNAGAAIETLGANAFIVPQGELYHTTGASSTGAMQFELWYQPLDEQAYVVAQPAGTAII